MQTGVLTLDSLRELIRDQRARGLTPLVILLSEHEKRDIKQELMHAAGEQCKAETSVDESIESGKLLDRDGNALPDDSLIGIVQGVFIASHPEVSRGRARIIPKVT